MLRKLFWFCGLKQGRSNTRNRPGHLFENRFGSHVYTFCDPFPRTRQSNARCGHDCPLGDAVLWFAENITRCINSREVLLHHRNFALAAAALCSVRPSWACGELTRTPDGSRRTRFVAFRDVTALERAVANQQAVICHSFWKNAILTL